MTYGPVTITSGPDLPTFAEWYSYLPSGLTAAKRLQAQQKAAVNWFSTQTVTLTPINLESPYTNDSGGEGHIASIAYPSGGPTYSYNLSAVAYDAAKPAHSNDLLRTYRTKKLQHLKTGSNPKSVMAVEAL